jgi:hypothetical protein
MISINIQGSSVKFSLQVEPEETIEAIKGKIIEQSEGEKPTLQQLRLIYSGQILKNEKTIGEYNVKDGHTVHLVKSQPPQPAASAPFQPPPQQPQAQQQQLPPLSAFREPMNSEVLMQQALGGGTGPGSMNATQLKSVIQMMRANPELLRRVVQNNPMAAGSPEMNEQLTQMMMEPGRLEQMIDMMTDPGMNIH